MIEYIVGGGVLLWLFLSGDDKKGGGGGGGGEIKPAPPNGVYPDAGMTLQRAQEILLKLGYDLGKWGADGKYGGMTRAAFITYQGKNDLEAHGYLDKQTADSLAGETFAAPTVMWWELGHQRGYENGYSSKGVGYHPLDGCDYVGAIKDGVCDPQYTKGYDLGFPKGAYDSGYQRGQSGEPEFDFAGSATYIKGYVDGKASAVAGVAGWKRRRYARR